MIRTTNQYTKSLTHSSGKPEACLIKQNLDWRPRTARHSPIGKIWVCNSTFQSDSDALWSSRFFCSKLQTIFKVGTSGPQERTVKRLKLGSQWRKSMAYYSVLDCSIFEILSGLRAEDYTILPGNLLAREDNRLRLFRFGARTRGNQSCCFLSVDVDWIASLCTVFQIVFAGS